MKREKQKRTDRQTETERQGQRGIEARLHCRLTCMDSGGVGWGEGG